MTGSAYHTVSENLRITRVGHPKPNIIHPPEPRVYMKLPPSGDVQYLGLMLHGFSLSGMNILRAGAPTAHALLPQALLVAPDAPKRTPPEVHERAKILRSRYGSWSWFDMPEKRFNAGAQIAPSLRASLNMLHKLLDDLLTQYGLDESRLYIIGYSQGGAMATHLAIERERPCAGVYSFCGFMFDPRILGMTKPKSRPPIFYAYAQGDNIVTQPLFAHTVTTMKAYKLPVALMLVPGVYTREEVARGKKQHPTEPDFTIKILHHKDHESKPTCAVRVYESGHTVSPRMILAAEQFFHFGFAYAELGVVPLYRVRTPKLSLEWLERGHAVDPAKPPAPLPHPIPTYGAAEKTSFWRQSANYALSMAGRGIGYAFWRIAHPLADSYLYDHPPHFPITLKSLPYKPIRKGRLKSAFPFL